jgi:outer membrane cobalamin receptor
MTIRRSLFLFLYFLLFYAGTAQKIELKGRIAERSSGEALVSALIKVKGSQAAALSDANGHYTLLLDKKGLHTITVSYIGFREESRRIDLQGDQTLDFLLENDLQLDEILVTAAAPFEPIKSPTMGLERLTAAQIRQMPALMGEVDLLKAIQFLPGVEAASEGSSGFSVRGGSPDQNLILMDQTTVYNASHLMGFFSIFNSDVLQGLDLYKGDIPVKYGGRIASLLDVRTKNHHSERLHATGGIGLISSRLTLEGPLGEQTSWLLGGRRSYADLFLRLSSEEALRQSSVYFYDLNARMTHRFSARDRVEISAYYGKDHFGAQPGDFHYGNGALSASWHHICSDKRSLKTGLHISRYDYGLESKLQGSRSTWQSSITDYQVRLDYSHTLRERWHLTYGLSSQLHRFKPGYARLETSPAADAPPAYAIDAANALEHGLYLSSEQPLSERLSVKYGIRLSAFQNLGRATVCHYDENHQAVDSTLQPAGKIYHTCTVAEPRLGLVLQLARNASLKGNYVHNVQFMQLANNSASGSPLDVWFPAGPNIPPQIVDLFSLGYFRRLAADRYEASVEIYYKTQQNVIDFAEHADLLLNKQLESQVRIGKGRAYGLEWMLRKPAGRLSGFINYTLARSERTIPDVNRGRTYLSPYDKTHSIHLLLGYELSDRISIAATWVYATGHPTTYPAGRFEIGGEYFPIYSGRNEYRRPDYHRLDLSFTYVPRPCAATPWRGEWNVSLYNAYGKKNPWMITYNQHEDTGLPYAEMIYLFGLVPSITYNFKF